MVEQAAAEGDARQITPSAAWPLFMPRRRKEKRQLAIRRGDGDGEEKNWMMTFQSPREMGWAGMVEGGRGKRKERRHAKGGGGDRASNHSLLLLLHFL